MAAWWAWVLGREPCDPAPCICRGRREAEHDGGRLWVYVDGELMGCIDGMKRL